MRLASRFSGSASSEKRHLGRDPAIIPGVCGVCVWSPGLDEKGNSVAGVAALEEFTSLTGWSVF